MSDDYCIAGGVPSEHLKRTRALLLLAAVVLPFSSRLNAREYEFLPEVDSFLKLSEVSRLYLNSQVTIVRPNGVTQTEAGANFDITLTPIFRRHLRTDDWEHDRYLWMRVGYEVYGSPDDEGHGPTERRGVVEGTAQARLSTLYRVWIVSRLRVDFRDIGGSFSKRYRFRLVVEKEMRGGNGKTIVPYIRAETLYDTRYNAWNRQIYTAGIEIEATRHWRLEPYVSRQYDSHSPTANVDQIGVQLKAYW
ncbi:hypothetical protein [Dyella japonica]|uniref:DUF2490 domain-containing protein n=1 Tax=Dyella japonica TaxID=231455 RepID=A0ABV2K112_9GAMM